MRVAPFKAQNMSNNAAICKDGAEIGRAQYVQALAAGIDPCVEINPLLIKPEADARSQVVLMGKPYCTLSAKDFYRHKEIFWENITDALDRLRADFDLVIIEGAGSPVEINLKSGDIVNMAIAKYAKSPVLLVGDIDRGGIFAQLLGTLWLLETEERELVQGLLVNKFRGDMDLFVNGVRILEKRSSLPVLGVMPYIPDLHVPEEDAVTLENPDNKHRNPSADIEIVVIRLPRISNFDDFDPFVADKGVDVRYVDDPLEVGHPNAIIIPGTKSTIDDLLWLRQRGLTQILMEYAHDGGALVGVCGGYQMLGLTINDPNKVESYQSITKGLGLLPIETTFLGNKATYQVSAKINSMTAWLAPIYGQIVAGYEIHMGRTESISPWLQIDFRNGEVVQIPDGDINSDGRIWGCYLHGIFANQNFRHAWLRYLGWRETNEKILYSFDIFAQALTQLTNEFENAIDMRKLETILWGS